MRAFVYLALWHFAMWRADRGADRSVYWSEKAGEWHRLARPDLTAAGE